MIGLACCIGAVLLLDVVVVADGPDGQQARTAMHKAVKFFRQRASAEGGYVYQLSADLSKREGEGRVSDTIAWVEPPGTPAVGSAYLEAYRCPATRCC